MDIEAPTTSTATITLPLFDPVLFRTESFHPRRADELKALKPAEITEIEPYVTSTGELPEEIVEFATIKGVTKEGLILEVDETHIVSSSAIN